MSDTSQRVFYDDGSNLTDITRQVGHIDDRNFTVNYVTGHYIYLATDYRFNSRYFQVTTAADATVSMTVEFWNGKEWLAFQDLQDDTLGSTAGSLAENGCVQFCADCENWCCYCSDRNSPLTIAPFTDMVLCGCKYFSRISFSADVNFTLDYVGTLLCNHGDLCNWYPDLCNSSLLECFEPGKTTWDEQALLASNQVIKCIRQMVGDKWDRIRLEDYATAAIHKTAEIIYGGLENMPESLARAKILFDQEMNKITPKLADHHRHDGEADHEGEGLSNSFYYQER